MRPFFTGLAINVWLLFASTAVRECPVGLRVRLEFAAAETPYHGPVRAGRQRRYSHSGCRLSWSLRWPRAYGVLATCQKTLAENQGFKTRLSVYGMFFSCQGLRKQLADKGKHSSNPSTTLAYRRAASRRSAGAPRDREAKRLCSNGLRSDAWMPRWTTGRVNAWRCQAVSGADWTNVDLSGGKYSHPNTGCSIAPR